jgi:hypothetical protein
MPAGKSPGSTAREYRRNNILLWSTKLPWCNAENYVPQPTYLLIAVARPEIRRPTHASPSLRLPWMRVVQTRPRCCGPAKRRHRKE